MKHLFYAVLLGLLTCPPATATTLISTEAAQTSDVVFRLRDACKAFDIEYGYFPPSDAAIMLPLLQGEEIHGHNWRKIVFWAPRQPTTKWFFWTSPGDFNAKGDLIDGWAQPFRFETTTEGLVIWSKGPKGIDTKEHAIKAMRGVILLPKQ